MIRGKQPVIKAGVLIVKIHRKEEYCAEYSHAQDCQNQDGACV